ncbi:MAG: tRNA and rRNA cytosine-C5-methylase, partial [Gemmiger qucibialis]
MIISQLPELFVQRERALLGPRFDAMFSYPGQGAVRGASVNALRCTPQQFAELADFPLEESPFCASAFVVPQPDWKPGRHPYHHAGAFYAQEPSASAPAALLDVHPGMRVADLCA